MLLLETTGCINKLTFDWSTEMRVACSVALLRYPRTCTGQLLLDNAIRDTVAAASPRYLCRGAFQRKRRSPRAGRGGFHLSVMGMIIQHDRTSIIDRYMSEILLVGTRCSWIMQIERAGGSRSSRDWPSAESKYSRNQKQRYYIDLWLQESQDTRI